MERGWLPAHESQYVQQPQLKRSQWAGQNSGVLLLPWDALSSKIQAYMPIEEIQDYSHMVLKHYVLQDQILLNQLTFTSVCVSVIAAVDL